jgi:RimJ/RimL family protein N-acetyltransferase
LLAKNFSLKKSYVPVVVRSYESGDQEAIQEFVRQVARETTHTLKYEAMPEMTREYLVNQYDGVIKHPVNLTMGAFLNDKLVGDLRFFQRSERHPWIKHIGVFGMAVAQDYWGEGLGSKMLQLMIEHAEQKGIVRIEAEVRVSNENGVRLYQKNGFKIEGVREKAAFINWRYEDEYYISRLIP